MRETEALLGLWSVPGVGSHRLRRLVGHFGSADAVLRTSKAELSSLDGIEKKTAEHIKHNVDQRFVEDQLSRAEKVKARLISFWDVGYPEVLKTIYDPPALLYVKGDIKDEGKRIAVVGMRSPSDYGRWVAERFGEDLSRSGITVVSGMARGVDTCAHRGCLKGDGRTVAVLGSGLDVVYPPENKALYAKIIETGAVLSEFPLGTEPAAMHFPRRNRIISGLSQGTVVVEAGEKSGALITAYMALEQGREVFAVPGNIRSRKTRGVHKLIKEGAKLVEGIDDVLAEMPQWQKTAKDGRDERKRVDMLSEDEKSIWQVLSDQPIHIDRIVQETERTPSEALALLLSMELQGSVKQLPGKMFVRQ